MPELPEVETIVRNFRPHLEGRRITAFASRWPRNTLPSVRGVRRGIIGRTIRRLDRRAKLIVFHFDDGGHLLVHLRMSGRLAWLTDSDHEPRFVRAVWQLDDGRHLLLCDARKFARIRYERDLAAATADLGPEPLDRGFTVAAFGRVLANHRRQLKPLLLDQSVIAGLGNIYTDEALFRAGLHPTTSSHRLAAEQVARLHRAIRETLRLAIRHHGTMIDWVYPGGTMQERLLVYGRTGQPCHCCGRPIEALRIAQRGTHICPACQPDGNRRTRARRVRT